MDIISIAQDLETKFNAKTDKGESLYGVKITCDPFEELSNSLPAVFIDVDLSRVNTSANGYPVDANNSISIHCLVSAQNKKWTEYKPAAAALMKKVMTIITTDVNKAQYKIKQNELEIGYSEGMLGATKISGAIITMKIDSVFTLS